MKDCSRKIGLLSEMVALLPRGQGAVPRAIGKIFRGLFADCYVLTRHGIKLVVTSAALDFFTTMARSDWAFDYWVLDTCATLMPDTGVFYDVGANAGYLSLEMTRLRPDYRSVVSFEPQSELAHNLGRSCELNEIRNVSIIEACVGDASGDISFTRERHSIHAHVEYPGDTAGDEHTHGTTLQVTLDDVVSQGDLLPPDVIKIDVEGYEYSVLQGARAVIANHQPHIVFELSDATSKFGRNPREFFDLLSSLAGYRYEIAVGSYREAVMIDDLEEFDRKFIVQPYQTNILARAKIRLPEH